MGTATCTVNGWRARVSKVWYPTDGSWGDPSKDLSVNCVASCPTTDSGAQSANMYTVCIKVTTPNSSAIGQITSITIGFYVYDMNTTSGYLYGSLRTLDPDNGTSTSDTIYTFTETAGAGYALEQCVSPGSYPIETCYMTFTGNFDKNTSYYLYLYTHSTNDVYHLETSSTAYTCTCEYSKACTISFSAGDGSGTVPASITGAEGETVTIGTTKPTPPANSAATNTTFAITAYNGSTKFGTHNATKSTYTKYSFANWQGGGWTVASGGTITITGDITLVAQYTGSTVTTYSNNTIANVSSTVGTPTKASTTENVPVLLDATTNGGTTTTSKVNAIKTTKYTHTGWNTSASATSALATSKTFTSATSLYAIYSSSSSMGAATLPTSGVSKASENVAGYTINLNPGAGTVSPTSIVAGMVRSYKFLGWGKTASATSYITTYTPSASNETVYAIFDSGTVAEQPATLPTPVRANYAFLGWSTSEGSTSYVDTIYMPTDNITLYANYKLSNGVEMYIYSSGDWRRATGYLCAQGLLFNKCVDSE